jgi:radical SAM-linked protein
MLVFGLKITIMLIQNEIRRGPKLNWRPKEGTQITASNETMLVAVKFKIRGRLRFLSHAETLRLFQRACVRAGIILRYSLGFNPRPKLSLPLPRSVGLQADDDLLTLQIAGDQSSFNAEDFKAALSAHLPAGCQLLSVDVPKPKTSFQPSAATYLFELPRRDQTRDYLNENSKATARRLLESENLNLQRRIDAGGRTRNVDVRPFLKSIQIRDTDIIVECAISSAGSIRVEEILKLLELDAEMLAAPIRRTSVKWQEQNKDK